MLIAPAAPAPPVPELPDVALGWKAADSGLSGWLAKMERSLRTLASWEAARSDASGVGIRLVSGVLEHARVSDRS